MRKFLLFIILFLIFFGCSQVLTKNKYKNETKETNKIPEEAEALQVEKYYLRYFNFQHANSTLREAHLEFMNNDGKRDIQALLLAGEVLPSEFCNNKITIEFDRFVGEFDYNDVFITVDYLGKEQQFNLSRNDKSALQFSCSGIEKITKVFTTRKEAKHVFVGEKEFTLENDLMSDNSCDITKDYNKINLRHPDWYSKKYDETPELRRYMFRPNTVFCDSNDLYTLEEDKESKQCYTHLGKRDVNTLGCKNLEGAIGPGTDNE